jgi:hypothetical protein
LPDEALFEAYLAGRLGEAGAAHTAAHLSACGECGARYRALAQFMADARDGANEDTDSVFTPQQLRLQQQQILRRLEHLGHPARVISFPARLMRRRFGAATRIAPRWAAAAAAAGLFVGVGVGVLFDSPRPRPAAAAPVAVTSRLAAPIIAVSAPAVEPDDDAFLSELESALGGPHNQELLPFDALTPRVQEISSRPPR